MKRLHWWTLLGVSGIGLAALLLGQSVLGQPESRVPLPVPPLVSAQPDLPVAKPVPVAPKASEGTTSPFPPLPSMPPSAKPLDTDPHGLPAINPPPGMPPAPGTKSDGKFAGKVSLDVAQGRQQPAVSIEWVAQSAVRLNQPMACQIVVRNTSAVPVQNVVVRHQPGEGVTLNKCEPKAVSDGGALIWSIGTLGPDQTQRIEMVLVAKQRGALNCHASVTFTAVAGHQIQVREPQLAVKMRAPDKVIAGEAVTLLIAVSNPGDGVAEAVKLKALLPDGLENARGKVLEFDVGSLNPKEVRTLQLVCLAKGSGAQKCGIVASGDGNLSANDTASLEILMPKLDIVMTGPKLRYLDRRAVYLVKVTNPGNAPASGVEVHGFIPTGFKFHQASQGAQFNEATRLVTWNLGEVPAGQSKELAVDVIPIEPGEHRLIAQAKAARGLKSEADVRTLVEGLASLAIEVGHIDDPIEVGAETEYQIRVHNTGTKTETNVEVVCTLPAQLEFRGAKCSSTLRYRIDGRDLIFEPLARLAKNADVIYRVQVRGVAPGDIRFRTRIKADGLKEPVLRDESTRVYSDDAPVRQDLMPLKTAPIPSPAPAPTIPAAPTIPPAREAAPMPLLPPPSAPSPPPFPPIPPIN